jgi:chromosome segregation ATPase|tara:strand:- start:472 stop:759 length:288 start_codon:yes stop_codon:yes gene_type:complete
MMGTLTKDDVWKVVQMGLGMLVIPLGGWVWNMNVEVAELRNDLGDAEQVIDKLYKEKDKYRTRERELTSQIVGIEKDIEYMKDSLSRIEQLVTSK